MLMIGFMQEAVSFLDFDNSTSSPPCWGIPHTYFQCIISVGIIDKQLVAHIILGCIPEDAIIMILV